MPSTRAVSDSATAPGSAPVGAGPLLLPSIILVGMMGVGKTTIGRQLAAALGREFVDLDHVLESRCGVRITTIFDIEGEAGFRRRESLLLDEYTQRDGLVIATGGGAVLADGNRAMLRDRGCVVYLRAGADELYRRVARDRGRPLLQTENPRQRLIDLLTQREPLYESVADVTVDTGERPVAQVLHRLIPCLPFARQAHADQRPIDPSPADR